MYRLNIHIHINVVDTRILICRRLTTRFGECHVAYIRILCSACTNFIQTVSSDLLGSQIDTPCALLVSHGDVGFVLGPDDIPNASNSRKCYARGIALIRSTSLHLNLFTYIKLIQYDLTQSHSGIR